MLRSTSTLLVPNRSGDEPQSFSEAIIITSAPPEMVRAMRRREPVFKEPIRGGHISTPKPGAPFEFRLEISTSPAPRDFKSRSRTGVPALTNWIASFIVPAIHPRSTGQQLVFFLGKRLPMSISETAELGSFMVILVQSEVAFRFLPTLVKLDSPWTERGKRECLDLDFP